VKETKVYFAIFTLFFFDNNSMCLAKIACLDISLTICYYL